MRIGLELAKKVLAALATLFVLTIVVYFGSRFLHADPARAYLGKTADPEQISEFRIAQGLNKGAVAGYLSWLGHVFHGNWGTSILSQLPVTTVVIPRIGRTMLLALAGFMLGAPLGVGLGVFAGKRADTRLDVGMSAAVLVLAAMPEFLVAVVLLSVFGLYLRWVPVSSSGLLYGGIGTDITSYILPVLSLALIIIPHITRQVRITVSEIAAEPYIASARLRGLRRVQVTWRHLIPSAAARVVNVLALNLAELLTGVVVVETVFGFPGIGNELVTSIENNDIAVVQCCAIIMSLGYIAINFIADALVLILNPRMRKSRGYAV